MTFNPRESDMSSVFRQNRGRFNTPVRDTVKRFGARPKPRMRPFLFTFFTAIVAAELAKFLTTTVTSVRAIGQFPVHLLGTLLFTGFWIYGLMRCFQKAGWPSWLVLPVVIGLLCPLAWVFARRARDLVVISSCCSYSNLL